jgi:hypothetical protein
MPGGGGAPAGGGGVPSGGGGAGGAGGSGTCQQQTGSYGDYLLTFSAPVDASKPILFRANVAVQGSPPGLLLILTPLDALDRKTPVGANIEVSAPLAADGAFSAGLNAVTIPGAANPLSGTELQVDATLTGKVCGQAAFYCGDGDGNITKPIPLSLTGSTWTLDKYPVVGAPPDPPLIDCQKTPAGPPPQGTPP